MAQIGPAEGKWQGEEGDIPGWSDLMTDDTFGQIAAGTGYIVAGKGHAGRGVDEFRLSCYTTMAD